VVRRELHRCPRDVAGPVTLQAVDADRTLIEVRLVCSDTAVSITAVLTREQQLILLQELQAHVDRHSLAAPRALGKAASHCRMETHQDSPCSDCALTVSLTSGMHMADGEAYCWQLDDAMNGRR